LRLLEWGQGLDFLIFLFIYFLRLYFLLTIVHIWSRKRKCADSSSKMSVTYRDTGAFSSLWWKRAKRHCPSFLQSMIKIQAGLMSSSTIQQTFCFKNICHYFTSIIIIMMHHLLRTTFYCVKGFWIQN